MTFLLELVWEPRARAWGAYWVRRPDSGRGIIGFICDLGAQSVRVEWA